jgi:hypothetical protein
MLKKRQLILPLALILNLARCAPPPTPPLPAQPRTVDAAFETYVQSFEAIFGEKVQMSIEFSNTLASQYAGMCTVEENDTYRYGTRMIQINPTYWPGIGFYGQQQLIYHELGHCALGRVHWSALDGNESGCTWDSNGNCDQGFPLTIMYPVAFGNNGNYQNNLQYYSNELFHWNPADIDANQGSIPPMGEGYARHRVNNRKTFVY